MTDPSIPARRRAVTKPDKRGRDGKRKRRANPASGPKECGVEQWGWRPIDLLASEGYRSLSRNAHVIIDRLLVEHVTHGGVMNGELVVSHRQFEEWGASRNHIAQGIHEAEAAGVIAVRRRGRIAGSNPPNLYRLTWIGGWGADGERLHPTNEWKARGAGHVDAARERRKRDRAARRTRSAPENVIAMPARNS